MRLEHAEGDDQRVVEGGTVSSSSVTCKSTVEELTSGGDAVSSDESWRGRADTVMAAAEAVAVASTAVWLDAPPAVKAVAEVVLKRLAHACAWVAAASLEAKGRPHAHPAEKRSRKVMRRCRVTR